MPYDSEQRKIIKTLISTGKKRGASKRDIVAALETGLVEANLHNPAGGDGSSVGWRQETASSYPSVNRRDVKGGANRFYDEIKNVRGNSGSAAQAVQRSAFPARYNQNKKQALDILHAYAGKGGSSKGGGGSSSKSGSSKVTAKVTIPGVDRSQDRKNLLISYLDQRDSPDSLLNLASGLKSAQDTPSQTLSKSIKVKGQKASSKSSGGGGGDLVSLQKKMQGKANFEGVTVAHWLVPALKYAREHGWKGAVTSGYRSHAHNVAQGRTYHSMHEDTKYPGGAVDFGGMQDSAGLANREAFLKALKGFKGLKPQRPKGFRDDGHTSGTGG